MLIFNKTLNVQDLSHKEMISVNGGGIIFESIARFFGYIAGNAVRTVEEKSHPVFHGEGAGLLTK